MEKLVRGSSKTEIYGMKINEDLKKHQNDKRVLEKLAEANALIERMGVPTDLYLYENQATTHADNLPANEELATENGHKINKDLEKYRNDERFIKKRDEMNELIARIGLPAELYENQPVTYADILLAAEESAVVAEPQAKYGAAKETEE